MFPLRSGLTIRLNKGVQNWGREMVRFYTSAGRGMYVLTRSGRRMFPDQNRFTEWNHFLNRKWPRIDNQIAPKLPTSSPNRGLGLGHAGVFGCLLRKFAIAYSFKSNICHTTNLLFVCCFTRCCLATADFEGAAFQSCRGCLAG